MIATRPDVADVWKWLDDVPDPEVPAVSIVDLGIVRDVAWRDESGEENLVVSLTPTYSACPATRVIEREVERVLRERGIARMRIDVVLSPAWTTDWMSDVGRKKLRAYGIAPPQRTAGVLDITRFVAPSVLCPRCASSDVELTSRFGSTPCKALYRCIACREPFDHFKCH